jgi:hypothetical protein
LTLDVMDVASRAARSVPLNDVERLLLDGVDQAWLAYHPSGRDLLFESMVILVLNMHCRFCPDCDLLIVHQDELEAQLAAHMAERDPSIIANEYIVIGTVERAALDKLAAGTQGFDPVEIQAAVEKMVKGKTGHQSTQDWLSDDIKRKLKRPKKK